MAGNNNDFSPDTELIRIWELPTSTTLGSAVRAKGILQEIRARIPITVRKNLTLEARTLTLISSYSLRTPFRAAVSIVEETLQNVTALHIIPREIEDILVITSTERRRWLNDGRLISAGTRTVRLKGRAKKITFHIFDPILIEDLLDRDIVMIWRKNDAIAAVEKRQRAAVIAKMRRTIKVTKPPKPQLESDIPEPKLLDWEDFNADGFLK